VTVVLSERGWVRAAKGHNVDAANLSYKSGDAFLAAAAGKTNQTLLFLDSTGRAYSVGAHGLPSARGQGEPLTGRMNPPDGARFVGLLLGETQQRCVLGTDKGFGFIASLGDLVSKTRNGKAVLTVPKGASVLAPLTVNGTTTDELAVVTGEGRLLVFPVAEMPELARGKGNKLMQIRGEDRITAWAVVPQGAALVLDSGKRHLTLKGGDLDNYRGARGQRGRKLPRGFQRVHGARTA
jgi:topoisomerase-4 subunit A